MVELDFREPSTRCAGRPLVAWARAEAKPVVMPTEGTKVAVRPRASNKGLTEGGEIRRAIKSLIREEQGKMIRSKVKERA